MNKAKTIIFIGPQGSGKGTQAKILAKKIGAEYIEAGALLRKISKQESTFGRYVRDIIDNGGLMEDKDMEDILATRLAGIHPNDSIIFDGVPRREKQALWMLDYLTTNDRGSIITIFLNLSREESIKRLVLRRVCEVCGRGTIWHGQQGQVCDRCSGKLVARGDDTPEFINIRLDNYTKETVPVINLLKEKTSFFEIDASASIEKIANDIDNALSQ